MQTLDLTPLTLADTLRRHTTAHEIVATHADGRRVQLGFSGRVTKHTLAVAAQRGAEQIVGLCNGWEGNSYYDRKRGWVFGPVRVHFSGRTEQRA